MRRNFLINSHDSSFCLGVLIVGILPYNILRVHKGQRAPSPPEAQSLEGPKL